MNAKISEYNNEIKLNSKVVHTLPDTLLPLQTAIEKLIGTNTLPLRKP